MLNLLASISLLSSCVLFPANFKASSTDASNWETYRNDKMGFEIKHPKNWRIQTVSGTSSESVLLSKTRVDGQPNRLLQFWVQRGVNPNGMLISQWYTAQLKQAKATSPSARSAKVGGRPALLREVTGQSGRHYDFFVSLNKTDIFEITITQPSSEALLDPEYVDIISTLKFLP